ncbi:MAG: hypothetical protein AB7G08_30555 [Hyphomicrobiaceae bacterium]
MRKKRRKMPRYASLLPRESYFWEKSAEWRLRLVNEAKKRPAEWRFALIFKRDHQPESWNVGPNGFGRDVQFRVSTERNAAGYFVGWRSVEEKEGARMLYDYVADKERATCRTKTLKRALRYAIKRGNVRAAAALEVELAGK